MMHSSVFQSPVVSETLQTSHLKEDKDDLVREVQALFVEKLYIPIESVTEDLFQTGVLDSMTLVQLILHMEERFGLHVSVENLQIDSFRSITSIAELVTGNMNGQRESGR